MTGLFKYLVPALIIVSLSQISPVSHAFTADDEPEWAHTIFALPGTGGEDSIIAYDSGNGMEIYGFGIFYDVSTRTTMDFARWDGSDWLPIANTPRVQSYTTFNDGTGNKLYLGYYSNSSRSLLGVYDGHELVNIAQEDGPNAVVNDMVVYNDFRGSELYIAGRFSRVGDVEALHIAKWDGQQWSPAGDLPSKVGNLAVVNRQIFATQISSGITIVAKTGAHWDAVPGVFNNQIFALCGFDSGDGAELYAAGDFTQISGRRARHIAKFDGTQWREVNRGFDGSVFDLASSQNKLFAAGDFTRAGNVNANRVAALIEGEWKKLDSGLKPFRVDSIKSVGEGRTTRLYASGKFNKAGGKVVNGKACWTGRRWLPLWNETKWDAIGNGQGIKVLDNEIHIGVEAFASYDDGSEAGQRLYVGGQFNENGTLSGTNHIVCWNGKKWKKLGVGIDSSESTYPRVLSLQTFDDGDNEYLYVGGVFDKAGEIAVQNFARWDGTSWLQVSGEPGFYVTAMTVYQGVNNDQPALYVAGGIPQGNYDWVSSIKKWDGTSWHDVGQQTFDDVIWSLQGFNDGNQKTLFAGGDFSHVGGAVASGIAQWDGSQWREVGGGVVADYSDAGVNALAVYDDGAGSALYVAGFFHKAGGVDTGLIAKWDGTEWSPLGLGITSRGESHVYSLHVYDDGTGVEPALYVAGQFSYANNALAKSIAKWDGESWTAVDSGVTGFVQTMTTYDDGFGESLFVGGLFDKAGGHPSNLIARWGPPLPIDDDQNGPSYNARIRRLRINEGELLRGNKAQLKKSDDKYVKIRSESETNGFPNHSTQIVILFESEVQNPRLLDVIIESRINDPAGRADVFLMNWQTGEFDLAGTYVVGLQEESKVFENLDATLYIDGSSGRIKLVIEHSLPFSMNDDGFKSIYDRTKIRVRE